MSDPSPPAPMSGRATAAAFAVAVVVLVCAVYAAVAVLDDDGDTYYVSADGDDANDGSESEPFMTLERALQAAGDGDTVVLLSDITVDDRWDVYVGHSIVLDLGGHTLSLGEYPSICIWPAESGGSIDVTVRDGSIVREDYEGGYAPVYVGNWADGSRTTALFSGVEIRSAGDAVCIDGTSRTSLTMENCDVVASGGWCVFSYPDAYGMSLSVEGGSYVSEGDYAFYLEGGLDVAFTDVDVRGAGGFCFRCEGSAVLDGVRVTLSDDASPFYEGMAVHVGIGVYDVGEPGCDADVTLRDVTVSSDGAAVDADVYFGFTEDVRDPFGADIDAATPSSLGSSLRICGPDGSPVFEVRGSSESSVNALLIGLEGDSVTIGGRLSGCATVYGRVSVAGSGLVLAQTDDDMVLTVAASGVFDAGAGVTAVAQNVVVEGTVVLGGEPSEIDLRAPDEYWWGDLGPFDASELQDISVGEVTYAADTETWSGYVARVEVTGTLRHFEEVPPQFADTVDGDGYGYYMVLDMGFMNVSGGAYVVIPQEGPDGGTVYAVYGVDADEGYVLEPFYTEWFVDGECDMVDWVVYDADGDGSEFLPTVFLVHFVLEAARARGQPSPPRRRRRGLSPAASVRMESKD